MKPHTGIGFYSHSNEEGFTQCHEVAAEFGGGGHPTAAGAGFDFDKFRELASYWATCGDNKRAELLDAVTAVYDPD